MNIKTYFLPVLLMVFAQCLQAQPSNRMLRQIPGDALLVSHINTGALNEKLDIDRLKGLPIVQYYAEQGIRSAGEDSTIIKKLYDNPDEYGISLTSYIYMFLDLDVDISGDDAAENVKNAPPPQFYTVIPLNSRRKFQQFLQQVLKEQYDDFVQKEWGYKYYYKRNFAIGWSRNFMVMTSGGKSSLENTEEVFKDIFDRSFKVKRRESLLKSDDYETAQAERNDMGAWFNMDRLLDLSEKSEDLDETLFTFMEDLRGSHMSFNLNFEKGKIVLENITGLEDELSVYTKDLYAKRLNPKMLHYIDPSKMQSVSGFAFNVETVKDYIEDESHGDFGMDSVLDFLQEAVIDEWTKDETYYPIEDFEEAVEVEEMEDTFEDAEEEVVEESEADQEEEISEPEETTEEVQDTLSVQDEMSIEEQIDSTLHEFQLDREDLWTIFKGDILLGLTGSYEKVDTFMTYEYIENEDGDYVYDEIEKTEISRSPYYRGMMTTGDPKKLKNIFLKLDSLNFVDADGDRFKTVESDPRAYIWILEEDSLLIVTNEEEFNPAYDRRDDITENGMIGEYFRDYPFFVHIDYQQISDLMNPQGNDKQLNDEALKYLSGFKFISRITDNNNLLTGTSVILKNPEDNSLHQIFDIVNGFYERMTSGGH